MNSLIRRLLSFLILSLVQVLILNKIHLFGYATPMLYVWFILTMESTEGRNKVMLWAFALGLVMDIFGNTLGIHAAATTALAFIRPLLIRLFFIRNEGEPFTPGIRSMGGAAFMGYALLGIALHHCIVFGLEYFSFTHPLQLGISIVSSSLFTMLFVMAIERLRQRTEMQEGRRDGRRKSQLP